MKEATPAERLTSGYAGRPQWSDVT